MRGVRTWKAGNVLSRDAFAQRGYRMRRRGDTFSSNGISRQYKQTFYDNVAFIIMYYKTKDIPQINATCTAVKVKI